MEIQYVQQEIKKQVAIPAKHYDNIPPKISKRLEVMPSSMTLKQLLIVFQKCIQNIYSKEQRVRRKMEKWMERKMQEK